MEGEEELVYLRQAVADENNSYQEISQHLRWSVIAVKNKCQGLGLHPTFTHPCFWSIEEDEELERLWKAKKGSSPKDKELAQALGRTATSIKLRRLSLGLRSSYYWSEEELDYLRLTCDDKESTCQEVADFLGRTQYAVRNVVTKMRLGGVSQKKWSEKELDYVKRSYHKVQLDDMAEYLGRSKEAIKRKAYQMGAQRQKPIKINDKATFVALAEAGKTRREIAKHFKASYQSVLDYAKYHGIVIAYEPKDNSRHPWRMQDEIFFEKRRNNEKSEDD